MNRHIKNEISGILTNLNNGLRLVFLNRLPLERYHISFDQSFLLVFFYAAVCFMGSLYLSLPNPEFSAYGLDRLATQLFFILLTTYALSKISKDTNFMSIFIVLLSLWPWIYILWLILGNEENFNYWEFEGDRKHLYFFYNIWVTAIFLRTAPLFVRLRKKEFGLALLTFILLLLAPLQYVADGSFWYAAYQGSDEHEEKIKINVENTFYSQFDLMREIKGAILPQRKNIIDLYFIGFGAYADQDVFMKEVHYIRDLFDNRFNTNGRSIALINNRQTVETTPLASKSNLNSAVQHIGRMLNPDEDILFLYLTSHGSKHHELSVDFVPLRLNSIEPHHLKEMLERSGIKYRVLVISACYSGGFIEQLKDDHSLIITSAALDRQSFGCSYESDFTYMGEAIFDVHLKNGFDFIEAFHKAIASIQQRETLEGLDPSTPQLFIGEKIRPKLEMLEQQLADSNKHLPNDLTSMQRSD